MQTTDVTRAGEVFIMNNLWQVLRFVLKPIAHKGLQFTSSKTVSVNQSLDIIPVQPKLSPSALAVSEAGHACWKARSGWHGHAGSFETTDSKNHRCRTQSGRAGRNSCK